MEVTVISYGSNSAAACGDACTNGNADSLGISGGAVAADPIQGQDALTGIRLAYTTEIFKLKKSVFSQTRL